MKTHDGDVTIGASRGSTKLKETGDDRGTGRYFHGRLDQVRLWKSALSRRDLRERATRTLDLNDAVADQLLATYRYDTGSGRTAFDYPPSDAPFLDEAFVGNPQWTSFSGARLGRHSAVLDRGSETATVGPPGGNVTAENFSGAGGDGVQVYQFGRVEGPVIYADRVGEVFADVEATHRLNVVWGLTPVGHAPRRPSRSTFAASRR